MEKYNLHMCFEPVNKAFNISGTTDAGSCLDMCLTTDDDAGKHLYQETYAEWPCVYESYFSDHKPVWMSIRRCRKNK